MNFPMTERYDLLIASMRAASREVLYCFGAALALVLLRPLVRFILPPGLVPVFLERALYNLTDLLVVAPVLVLFILSE